MRQILVDITAVICLLGNLLYFKVAIWWLLSFLGARLFEKITRWLMALICSWGSNDLFPTFFPLHHFESWQLSSITVLDLMNSLFVFLQKLCVQAFPVGLFSIIQLGEEDLWWEAVWMVPCVKTAEFTYWAIMMATEMLQIWEHILRLALSPIVSSSHCLLKRDFMSYCIGHSGHI